MANFVAVNVGGNSGWYINLDLVRVIQPDGPKGCVAIFADDNRLPLDLPSTVVAGAGKK